MKASGSQFTPGKLQGSPQIYGRAKWLLHSMQRSIPDMFHYVALCGVRWLIELSKFRRVFLEPLGSKSRLLGCHIVLLEFSISIGIHNGQEWLYVIGQDAYIPLTCQSIYPVSSWHAGYKTSWGSLHNHPRPYV